MKLFDDKHRTDLDPAGHNENAFGYFDRSARKEISNARDLLNSWFYNYPEVEKNELKSRFRKTFSSAFYELFIYTLFRKQDFDIDIHPTLSSSSKRPDFLMKKGGLEFYVEAKEATDKSAKEEALEKRINRVYDSIDKLFVPNFLLRIDELVLKSDRQPSTKKIISVIQTEAAKCDPDELADRISRFGLDASTQVSYENDDWKIIVSFIPKIPSARGVNDGGAIGIYPMGTHWGGSEESIKESVTKKAKRYGELDKPLIICINATGIKGIGDFDIENALWGSLALTWSTNPSNRDERWERQLDGVFLNKKGARIKNVCGILVTNVSEFNVMKAPHWLAKHPFSDVDFDFNVFDLSYYHVEDGHVRHMVKKSIGDILCG